MSGFVAPEKDRVKAPFVAPANEQEAASPPESIMDRIASATEAVSPLPFGPGKVIDALQTIGRGGKYVADTLDTGASLISKIPGLENVVEGERFPIEAAKFLLPKNSLEAAATIAQVPLSAMKFGNAAAKAAPKAAEEIGALAAKYGVELTPAEEAMSKELGKLESWLEKTPLGSPGINAVRQKAKDILAKLVESFGKEHGTFLSEREVGAAADKARFALGKESQAAVTEAYNKFNSLVGEHSNIPMNELEGSIQEGLDGKIGTAAKEALENVRARLFRPGQEVTGGSGPSYMTMQEVAQARSELGQAISAAKAGIAGRAGEAQAFGNDVRVLSKAYRSLVADERAYAELAGPDVVRAHEEALNLAKMSKGVFDNQVARQLRKFGESATKGLIDDAETERVYQSIVSNARRGQVTRIDQAKRAIGDAGFEPVQRRFFQDILDAGIHGEDKFGKPLGIVKASKQYSPEVLQKMLPPDAISKLGDLNKLIQASGSVERGIANPASGRLIVYAGTLGMGADALRRLSHGDISGAATEGMLALSPAAMAAIYLSPSVRPLLLRGLELEAGTKEATKIGAQLSGFLVAHGFPEYRRE